MIKYLSINKINDYYSPKKNRNANNYKINNIILYFVKNTFEFYYLYYFKIL